MQLLVWAGTDVPENVWTWTVVNGGRAHFCRQKSTIFRYTLGLAMVCVDLKTKNQLNSAQLKLCRQGWEAKQRQLA